MRQLNRILCAAVALALCVGLLSMAAPVSALSGSCGADLSWTLEDGVLTISGTGPMLRYTETNLPPWMEQAAQIQRLQVQAGVTRISDLAFYHCTNLTVATLADSVTEIGELAFAGCTALRQVTMGGVQRLERGCFYDCSALINVALPESLRYIGDESFFSCKSLGGITIPAGVEHLGNGVFTYCDSLAYADIQAPLTVLPTWTFYGCDALQQLYLPETVETVEQSALSECDALYHVDYGGSQTVKKELERQLAEPVTRPQGPKVDKDVTYTQTENAIITTTDKNTSGGGNTAGDGTYVDATVTGTQGWDDVSQSVNEVLEGGKTPQVNVQLQGEITIPGDTFTDLAGSDVTVNIHTPENVDWKIDLADQSKDVLDDQQDLQVTIEKNEPGKYSDTIQNAQSYTVTMGQTTMNTTVLLPLGSTAAGKTATLYVADGKTLQKLSSVYVDYDGKAAFSLAGTKAGDYVVALDVQNIPKQEVMVPEKMAGVYDITYGATLTDSQGNQYVITGRVNKLGFGLGTLTWIIVGVLVGSTLLVGIIMVMWNKQQKKAMQRKKLRRRRRPDEQDGQK